MFIIALTSLLALAVIYFVAKSHFIDPPQPIQNTSTVIILGVEIICEDANSGWQPPFKTCSDSPDGYIDIEGNSISPISVNDRMGHPPWVTAAAVRCYQRALKGLYV